MAEGKEILKTYKKLVTDRLPFEDSWEDAFKFSYPLRGQRFQNSDDDPISIHNNASTDKSVLFDITGKDAARLLASSMLSGLTPPNSQWFRLAVPDMTYEELDQDAKEWLEFAGRKLFKMIHASNYDAEAFEFMLDMVVGGVNGLFIEMMADGFKFEHMPLETLYLAETLKTGFIDSFYRRIIYTAQQLVNEFGIDNVDEEVRNSYNNDPYCSTQYKVIHTVRPRMKKGKQSKGQFAKTLPFESVYISYNSGKTYRESGFHEFPAVIPRWLRIPSTVYAVGAYDDALPDVKTLNRVVQLMLTNADMAISGTYVAKNDGVLNPNTTKIGARRIVFAANVDNIRPLTTAGDFRVTSAEIARLQKDIRRVLLADQLSPNEGPAMTALEVSVRTNLIRQLLGPVFGRFSAEFLKPMIHRTYGLAVRSGFIPPPPDSLGGIDFHPEYSSPLAKAAKLEEIQSMDSFEQALGAQMAVEPTVLDNYDMDKASKRRSELTGVPADLMRDQRAVQKIRDDRQKAQQEQQAQLQAQAAGQQSPQ